MSEDHPGLVAGRFNIESQEQVLYGKRAEAAVPGEADRVGAVRVFVTSTRSLAALHDGPLQRIEHGLGKRHAGTFAAIGSHSPREDVVAAASAARAAGAELLVGVGGGSVIDATKAMQLCLWQDVTTVEELEHYSSGFERTRDIALTLPENPIRMVSVSTTLSASEFTRRAGITDRARRAKQAFTHRLMVPRTAVLDPAATLATPRWLLFSSGIRAVDHAVETFCSPKASPATEAQSLQGLRLLAGALRAIEKDPADLGPRLTAQFGMWQAITPIAAGVETGASHGIGYALGAGFGVPHGYTSCVMLPAVLRWNAAVNRQRQQPLAAALGDSARDASDQIAELVSELGLPGTLRAVGLERAALPELARQALEYQPVKVNPRPVTCTKDVLEILELAW